MIFRWETDEQRLRRFMSIPPVKKLEWLRAMQEFRIKFQPARFRKIARRLRAG